MVSKISEEVVSQVSLQSNEKTALSHNDEMTEANNTEEINNFLDENVNSPVDDFNNKKYAKIKEIAIGTICLFIFVLCDFLSFGLGLFKAGDNAGKDHLTRFYSVLSFYTYFIATGLSCIFYFMYSSIKTCLVTGVIMEAKSDFNTMTKTAHRITAERLNNVAGADPAAIATQSFLNGYLCCIVATILFGVISVVIGNKRMGGMLKKVPMLAVNAVMGAAGISMFISSFQDLSDRFSEVAAAKTLLGTPESYYYGKLFGYASIPYIIGIIVFVLDLYLSFSFLLPIIALVLVAAVNIAWYSGLRHQMPMYVSVLYSPACQISFTGMKMTGLGVDSYDVFSLLLSLLNNISTLVSVTIFNLIHLNMNVPAFLSQTKKIDQKDVDLNKEWKVQGFNSLMTSITGYPIYFINCYTVFAEKNGFSDRRITVALSGLLLSLFIPISFITTFIPNLIGEVFMIYMGLCFINDFIINTYKFSNRHDKCIYAISTAFSLFVNTAFGFTFSIAFIMLEVLKAERLRKMDVTGDVNPCDAKYIKINYPVYFLTVDDFKMDIDKLDEGYTLDLSGCTYMDMDGNKALYEKLDEIGMINVLGMPENIYINVLNDKITMI